MRADHDDLEAFGGWSEENEPIVLLGDHSNRQLLADLHRVIVLGPDRGPKGYGQRDPSDPEAVPSGPRTNGGPRQDREIADRH
jgi:hypothetical protein